MPPDSEKQRIWAFANKDKNTKEGKAAKEFADADPGGKLPATKSKEDRRKTMYDHPKSKRD